MITSSNSKKEIPVETIIVSRNQGMIDWLNRKGITGEVKPFVTIDDIKGKHVVGALPAHIAQHALYVTSVDYENPSEKKRKDLTADDLDMLGARMFSYKIVPVVKN